MSSTMATTVQRIVVRLTARDKATLAAKANKLGIPMAELMRRGAFAYRSGEMDDDLGALADAAKGAANRAGASMDAAIEFIEPSNKRIAAMEARSALDGASPGPHQRGAGETYLYR
jgi:hypothetical protein